MPALVALTALLVLERLDSRTPWLRLLPVAAGSLSVGLALASALRRTGNPAASGISPAS